MRKIPALGLSLSMAIFLFSCSPSQTKGYLVIAGTTPESVQKKFVELANRTGDGKIIVFPMASGNWNNWRTPSVIEARTEAWKELGAREIEHHILTREQALDEENTKILDGVNAVWFWGGSQVRLADVLVGTPIHQRILEIYKNGGVIGGSSAGSQVMSEIMITGQQRTEIKPYDDPNEFISRLKRALFRFETIEAANVIPAPGFGFIKSAMIDTHSVKMKRYTRLISIVADNPQLLGIGIDDETAIIVKPDDTFEVAGERSVIVFDASGATVRIDSDHAISAYNVTMHILKAGDWFDLKAKKVMAPK